MDNKAVTVVSNFHGTEISEVSRKNRDGTRGNIPCPQSIKDYNKYMGAVDHADQLRGSYDVDRRSKKWWHRLFWGIIDIAFVNSFILYRLEDNDTMSLLDYR